LEGKDLLRLAIFEDAHIFLPQIINEAPVAIGSGEENAREISLHANNIIGVLREVVPLH
jgi:hypothetical protein